MPIRTVLLLGILAFCTARSLQAEPLQISGVYPHLRTTNKEGECGTGAVVPWADRLWVISYGPHLPFGSSDKLYEITPELEQIVRPESVGGTPANRFIHHKSGQLLIGPYLIDRDRNVRVLPPARMFGRLTGTAAHLSDPNRVYYATMEEGLYEVDVRSLHVRCLIRDGNLKESDRARVDAHHFDGMASELPGYHGKGLYSGQGLLVYSNNGDRDPRVVKDPTVPSGALGFFNGDGGWQLVRRNQFTEVTGPGGIEGASHPETDPVWSVGWDAKSLLLMLLEEGRWHAFRLPKASHSYDGAHGWNTEWPRIRDIGQPALLMTMHGAFWNFPKTFSRRDTSGILPISNYLRVIGDFAPWQGRVVFGCDDSAKNEFLNKRPFKNEHATPPQSNSNLWFLTPDALLKLGPVLGRGSVWLRETIAANTPSDPFLTNGYQRATLHITHQAESARSFTLEADSDGKNLWTPVLHTTLAAGSAASLPLPVSSSGKLPTWVRLKIDAPAKGVSAQFYLSNPDTRPAANHADFSGIPSLRTTAHPSERAVLRSLGPDHIGLLSRSGSVFAVDTNLHFENKTDATAAAALRKAAPFRADSIREDAASLILEEDGIRYRIPRGAERAPAQSGGRVCREVATERDLLNVGGTFFELPARNAQGIAKMRPVATHLLEIDDYASQFGLMFLSAGPIRASVRETNPAHLFTSADKSETLWAGVIDDLWKLGKPRGVGGPWKDTPVEAGTPSDPFLLTGYDRKTLTLRHTGRDPIQITVEVDVDGTGVWIPYRIFDVTDQKVEHVFPEGFGAYWLRVCSSKATVADAQLRFD